MRAVLSLRERLGPQPLRLLLSYHYYKGADLDALLANFGDVELDLFADSGAFSAYTLGAPIAVDEYAAWLRRWKHRFTCAAALDVIGDAEASNRQTQELISKVSDLSFPVLPVFHANDRGGFEWLSQYIADGHRYIGIAPNSLRWSGLQGTVDPWLARCFELRPENVKYHGFGMTSWELMKRYPWYSVDSSSWTSVFRFAQLMLFDGARGQWTKFDLREPRSALHHTRLLASYGLRPSDIKSKGYDRNRICAASVFSWRRAEQWINSKRDRKIMLATGDGRSKTSDGSPANIAESLQHSYLSVGGHAGGSTDCTVGGLSQSLSVYAASSNASDGSDVSVTGIQRGLHTYLVTVDGDAPNSPEPMAEALQRYRGEK
jgi:hypothetical protein